MVQGSLVRCAVDDDLTAGVVVKDGEVGRIVRGNGNEGVVVYARVKRQFSLRADGNFAGIGNGAAVVIRNTCVGPVYADFAAVVLKIRSVVHTRRF